MAAQTLSLELDKDDLKKILDRFDKAPLKIQRSATGVALTAGAKVVVKNAKAKAPACLKNTIKSVNRKTSKRLVSKLSVKAGTGDRPKQLVSKEITRELRKGGSKQIDCLPAMWVEFGTYGNRDYQGDEPYAPATLKKKSYASGRSNSPYWKHRTKWTPAKPFMRNSINDPNVEKAIAKRLNEYLEKKGF